MTETIAISRTAAKWLTGLKNVYNHITIEDNHPVKMKTVVVKYNVPPALPTVASRLGIIKNHGVDGEPNWLWNLEDKPNIHMVNQMLESQRKQAQESADRSKARKKLASEASDLEADEKAELESKISSKPLFIPASLIPDEQQNNVVPIVHAIHKKLEEWSEKDERILNALEKLIDIEFKDSMSIHERLDRVVVKVDSIAKSLNVKSKKKKFRLKWRNPFYTEKS